MRYLIILVFSLNFSVYGQELLQVANPAWENLTEHEKTEIQQQFVVESIPASTFGIIVDIQGIDRSTPGSNAGSSLGEAIGNATYIDKALRILCITSFSAFPTQLNQQVTSANLSEIGVMQRLLK